MSPIVPPRALTHPRLTARWHLLVSLAAGILAIAVTARFVLPQYWLLAGWDTAALTYLATVWCQIWPRNASETARLAEYTDPARAVADFLTLAAATASLAAIGFLLVRANQQQGSSRLWEIALGLVSILLSWAMIHTVFTLRYAHLYYDGEDGGIAFSGGAPEYSDFAYLAFTIGMTFQVSDTELETNLVRRAAVCHGLLSYLFGTGILAISINLVAGLSGGL